MYLCKPNKSKNNSSNYNFTFMKKLFTLIAVACMATSAFAQSVSWTEADVCTAGNIKPTYGTDLVLKVTDENNKISIDANNANFGTAEEYTKYTHRFKTGGKSTSKLALELTIPNDGTLKVLARSGKNSEARPIVFTQDDVEILNQALNDADAVEVQLDDDTKTKVFPVYSMSVKKGTVNITFPTNSINFYGFILETANGIKTLSAADVKQGAVYNLAGQKVNNNQKGIVIVNGKKVIK